MTAEGQRVLVICSFTEKPVRFDAPAGFRLSDGRLALKNYGAGDEGSGFVTKPYETRVYIFEQ